MLLIYPYFYSYVRVGFASFAQIRPRTPSQIRVMNGQARYAPERGVGGFPEFDPSSNTCANFGVLMSSIWRPLAGRCGSLLGVSPGGLGEPEVRRVGFASFALLPPSRARAPLLRLGEAELWFGRGAWRNARGTEIRTYGSSVCF